MFTDISMMYTNATSNDNLNGTLTTVVVFFNIGWVNILYQVLIASY